MALGCESKSDAYQREANSCTLAGKQSEAYKYSENHFVILTTEQYIFA